MSIDQRWRVLNEFQERATVAAAERPDRDLERTPWTDADNAALQSMVCGMTGRLSRMEDRLEVLYQCSKSQLTFNKRLWEYGCVALVAFLAGSALSKIVGG